MLTLAILTSLVVFIIIKNARYLMTGKNWSAKNYRLYTESDMRDTRYTVHN